MSELIEHGADLIQFIKYKRKPYKKFIAIYILEPTIKNIEKLEEDFL